MATITATDLVGSWLLHSWIITSQPSGRISLPYGERPEGIIMYTADGWMNATIGRAGRSLPANISPRKLPDKDLAKAWVSYFQYAGTYHIEGQDVVHAVKYSLNPTMVGTQQVRQMQLEGRQLTLTGRERFLDGERIHSLIWRRPDMRP